MRTAETAVGTYIYGDPVWIAGLRVCGYEVGGLMAFQKVVDALRIAVRIHTTADIEVAQTPAVRRGLMA